MYDRVPLREYVPNGRDHASISNPEISEQRRQELPITDLVQEARCLVDRDQMPFGKPFSQDPVRGYLSANGCCSNGHVVIVSISEGFSIKEPLLLEGCVRARLNSRSDLCPFLRGQFENIAIEFCKRMCLVWTVLSRRSSA